MVGGYSVTERICFNGKFFNLALTIVATLVWHSAIFAQTPTSGTTPPQAPAPTGTAEADVSPTPTAGLAFGGIVVPFKFELSGKSFAGSTDIGGYGGLNIAIPETKILGPAFYVMPLGFAGATNVGLDNMQPNGQQSGGSQEALSVGFGVILETIKNVQAGVVMGWDLTTKSYPQAGMPWISVDLGTSFFKTRTA